MELRGPVDVKLQLGRKEASLAVYLADMEDTCFLVIDYLMFHLYELDFRMSGMHHMQGSKRCCCTSLQPCQDGASAERVAEDQSSHAASKDKCEGLHDNS